MDQKIIAVSGVLVADQWKENGDIAGLALLTNDEKKYAVHYGEREQELLPLLRQKIELRGLLKDLSQKNTILVTAVQPVESVEGLDSLAI